MTDDLSQRPAGKTGDYSTRQPNALAVAIPGASIGRMGQPTKWVLRSDHERPCARPIRRRFSMPRQFIWPLPRITAQPPVAARPRIAAVAVAIAAIVTASIDASAQISPPNPGQAWPSPDRSDPPSRPDAGPPGAGPPGVWVEPPSSNNSGERRRPQPPAGSSGESYGCPAYEKDLELLV